MRERVIMIFAAGLQLPATCSALAACGLPALVALILLSPRREERLERTWLDHPWPDPPAAASRSSSRSSPSAPAASPAAASCAGLQKIGFLPEPNTDFIYAVIAEEFGLIGATLVLLAFFVIAWRGYSMATTMPDTSARSWRSA